MGPHGRVSRCVPMGKSPGETQPAPHLGAGVESSNLLVDANDQWPSYALLRKLAFLNECPESLATELKFLGCVLAISSAQPECLRQAQPKVCSGNGGETGRTFERFSTEILESLEAHVDAAGLVHNRLRTHISEPVHGIRRASLMALHAEWTMCRRWCGGIACQPARFDTNRAHAPSPISRWLRSRHLQGLGEVLIQ